MNVLIIPEDFTIDQYMLKPLIKAMLEAVGKPTANVQVCQDPRFRGIAQLMDWKQLEPVITRRYPMVDLFIICVDRDGEEGRKEGVNRLEQLAEEAAPGCIVLAENAWQEIEVWVLAGHVLPKAWNWKVLRQERDPKEKYYVPYATQRGVLDEPAQGRKRLAEEAARQYKRVRSRCPEDFAHLEERLAERLKQEESHA
jgi:hypothetical protein